MTHTFIITGASQGIGKATALQFARHGYNIVLAARQGDRLEEAASEVRAIGRDALAVSCDVRDPKQVDALVEQAIADFGSINMLINNAGIFALGPVEEFLLNFIRTHIIERTIFRGKNEQDWSDRYNLVNNAIHNPVLEKPEDVAAAIWKAVKYQQYDMLVGSARLSKAAYQLFPGLMLRLYQRLFGMRARHYRQ